MIDRLPAAEPIDVGIHKGHVAPQSTDLFANQHKLARCVREEDEHHRRDGSEDPKVPLHASRLAQILRRATAQGAYPGVNIARSIGDSRSVDRPLALPPDITLPISEKSS